MLILETASRLLGLKDKVIFRKESKEREVFLSFDDGPVPGVSDWVLDLLNAYNAKASFFVLGKQVEAHPELFARIRDEGHCIGNHSFEHPNGWKTKTKDYIQDFKKAEALIPSCYARPPYGRIKWSQMRALSNDYSLVFWDVLAKDYSAKETAESIIQRVCSKTKPGSIVVFHDSLKAEKKLKATLPTIMEYLSKQNYSFKGLN